MTKFSALDPDSKKHVAQEFSNMFHKRTSAMDETLKSLYKTGLMVNAGGITVLLPLLSKYLQNQYSYFLVFSLLAFTVGILFIVIVQYMSVKRLANYAIGLREFNENIQTDKIDIEDQTSVFQKLNNQSKPRIPNYFHYATFVAWGIGVVFIFLYLFLDITW